MGQHSNHTHNTKLQEVLQPKIKMERGIHFPDVDVLDHNLANEVGLNHNNQSAHWNMNSASLLNHYPTSVFQYKQLSASSEVKSGQNQKITGHPFRNFDEFLNGYQLEEESVDVPDTIWVT